MASPAPGIPAWPARLCQLPEFPGGLGHQLSKGGSLCESSRVASFCPACSFLILAHSAALLQRAPIQPATRKTLPFLFVVSHCPSCPTLRTTHRTQFQLVKNHSGALERERSGMGCLLPLLSPMWHSEYLSSFANSRHRETKLWSLQIRLVLILYFIILTQPNTLQGPRRLI